MMDKNVVFKKEDNHYKLFFIDVEKERDMGISFITDYNIEDYPISIKESIAGRICHYKPCKDVVIKLLNPPGLTKNIEISKDANLEFRSDFVLGIENSLVISQNTKTALFYALNNEGENILKFKELEISGNDNVHLYFNNSNVERSLDNLLLDSMKKQVQKINNNKNILFSFRKDVKAIDICNNTSNASSKNKSKVDVIVDSHLVSLNNVSIKLFSTSPTISLNADAVALEGTTFEVGSVLNITNKGKETLGGSKLAMANGTIKQTLSDIAHGKPARLTVDCDYLNIHSNVKLRIFGDNEIICQCGRVDFDGSKNSDCDLDNAKIVAPNNTELTIGKVVMRKNSLLERVEAKNRKCHIKKLYFFGGQMRGAKGSAIDASLSSSAKVDGIIFGDNSSFFFGASYFSADTGKYEAKDITLKDNASLHVKNSKPDNAYINIEDVIVSDKCEINGSLTANIKNSIVDQAKISFEKNQKDIDILNTIFKGDNHIEGVSSIQNSSVENCTIRGDKAHIEGEFLKDVTNYSEYVRINLENMQNKTAEEDLDIL